MKIFTIVLVFLLSLGQLQRIQVTNQLAFYLHDCLILIFLLWKIFASILSRKKIIENVKKIKIFQKKIFYILIGIIFTSWTLALISNQFDWRAILYLSRFVSYVLFVYLLQKELKSKSWLWRLVSFNILVLGLLQYLFLPDLRFLIYEGYDDHFYRLTSTILDPAFTGLIFVFNLNYYLSQKKKNWLIISLFAIGLLLTYSRSSYLAFLLSSLLLIYKEQWTNKKIILSILIIFFACLPFLPKKSGGDGVNLLRSASVEARLSNDQEILQRMNVKEWLIGGGLFVPANNRVVDEKIPSHSHFADNLFVFLLSNLGILGITFLAILLWQIADLKKGKNQIFLTSLVSNAMFNNALTQSFVLLIFLGFLLSDD